MRGVILLIAMATAVSTLHGETYLTEAEAVKIALPNAASVSTEVKQLSPEQRAALRHKSGLPFPEPQYKFFVGRAKRDGKAIGYAVIMNEIGKEEFITFIVGVNTKGEVGEVAILEYRETRGWEVRDKRFMHQFHGKKSTDSIQVDRDITNSTGATLSAHAIARGVKKALLLTEIFRQQ